MRVLPVFRGDDGYRLAFDVRGKAFTRDRRVQAALSGCLEGRQGKVRYRHSDPEQPTGRGRDPLSRQHLAGYAKRRAGSSQTRRWREVDSNIRYRGRAGVLVDLGVSLAPTFPQREIRKRRHEAVFEISIGACGTDGSNLVPSSGESPANLTFLDQIRRFIRCSGAIMLGDVGLKSGADRRARHIWFCVPIAWRDGSGASHDRMRSCGRDGRPDFNSSEGSARFAAWRDR